MELREATELRSMMEVRLRDFICKEIDVFEKKTNLYVSSIDICTQSISSMGQPEEAIVVTAVSVKANI